MQTVTLFRVQVRITITDIFWVGCIHVWIQVPNARTTYTHVIAHPDLLRHIDLIRQGQVRYYIKITGTKIHIWLVGKMSIQRSSFGTGSCLDTQFIDLQRITQISRIDMLVMTEITVRIIFRIPNIRRIVIILPQRFTITLAENIFSSYFQGMIFPQRSCIIDLRCMFSRGSIVDIPTWIQIILRIISFYIFQIGITFVIVRCMTKTIRERQ